MLKAISWFMIACVLALWVGLYAENQSALRGALREAALHCGIAPDYYACRQERLDMHGYTDCYTKRRD